MTSPKLAGKGPGGRWYAIPETIIEGGWKGPSVTTILSNGVPAPALKVWGERTVAEWAYRNKTEWEHLPVQDAIAIMARAPYNFMTSAGSRGTDIHQIAERILEGVAPDSWEGKLYGQHAVHIQNFLADFDVTPISWERTVINLEHGYAGSYDLLCEIDGETWLIDWKTSKGVYGKFGIQLAAYAKCEHEIVGEQLEPFPKVDRLGIVHITDAQYRLVPVTGDIDEMFATFQAMQIVAGFTVNGEHTLLGKRIDPIVGDIERGELIARIAALKDRTWLADEWPQNTPGLKEPGHVRWQIARITELVGQAEDRDRPFKNTRTKRSALAETKQTEKDQT